MAGLLGAHNYFAGFRLPADPQAECRRYAGLLAVAAPIDLACIGIGENGHLAFNDPPADFDTETPFLVVTLDAACRRQQVGEGWFSSLAEVPAQAISMSIRQIMKSAAILCTVPDLRKAASLRLAVEGPVTNRLPASILQEHPQCDYYMDARAASLLRTSNHCGSGAERPWSTPASYINERP